MTIGIHATAAFRGSPTGVELYTRRVIEEFYRMPDAQRHRFLLYTRSVENVLPAAQGDVDVLRSPIFWTQLRLSWEIARRPPDILFVPAQALPRKLPMRTVAVIHGVEFCRVPSCYPNWQRRYLHWITRDAVERADQIIAASHATKRDLLELYNVDPMKVTVIHHGAPIPIPVNLPARIPGGRPFFLFVGRLETKKNVDGIVRAFGLFAQRFRSSPHELLLLGGEGFGFPTIRRIVEAQSCRHRIRLCGYASEQEKWALLRDAAALIFPSRAEGFGIPILEAQAIGTPVITSLVTAMPEIAGEDAAIFVDPEDTEGLVEAMCRIVEDGKLREELIGRGIQNVKRFSWEKTAHKTFQVLLGNK